MIFLVDDGKKTEPSSLVKTDDKFIETFCSLLLFLLLGRQKDRL